MHVNALEKLRREKLDLFARLNPSEGAWPSPIPGILLIKNSWSYPPVSAFYGPCIILVAQGKKRFHFPDAVFTYDAQHYLLVTVPVPAGCEALVDSDGPFLGMAVRIDLQILADMLLQMEPPPQSISKTQRALTISAPCLEEEIARCGARLLRAMLRRSDAAVLGPLLVRELHYRALTGSGGAMLRALLTGNAFRQRIHHVLGGMHADFAAPFDVQQAAREAGMSISTFHERFREVTGQAPLHYLKQLRLHRARSLMAQMELSAAAVSEQVGYISQSQFSREFKREFGRSPLNEAQRLRSILRGSSPSQ